MQIDIGIPSFGRLSATYKGTDGENPSDTKDDRQRLTGSCLAESGKSIRFPRYLSNLRTECLSCSKYEERVNLWNVLVFVRRHMKSMISLEYALPHEGVS